MGVYIYDVLERKTIICGNRLDNHMHHVRITAAYLRAYNLSKKNLPKIAFYMIEF